MKKLLCYSLLLLFFYSCDSVLDIQPDNIIQDEQIFSNESGVEAYLATLYNGLPIDDFTLQPGGTHTYAHLTDDALNAVVDDVSNLLSNVTLPWWGYSHVRNVNDFIGKLPDADFPEEQKSIWMGEAKFIRAYYYFGMVKRYGGVPLITSVQQFTGDNYDELQVPRDTEQDIYDFIAEELDEAVGLLSETSEKGRANKYAALALKSRAMLFAGSVAQYGSMALDGLVGIPETEASRYWQAAYDAANQIIESSRYSLYDQHADKSQNFQELFLNSENSESIFVKIFKYPEKGHSYDRNYLPFSVRSPEGYGSRMNPTVELVEKFEYIDGSEGTLRLNDETGNPILYDHPTDLFDDKDPRLAGTVILPFAEWRGMEVDVQAGLFHNGERITTGNYDNLYDPETAQIGSTGIRIIGQNGPVGNIAVTQTGFYTRKYLNTRYEPSEVGTNRSDQDYVDFRYGEILLNYAEAAVELGLPSDALRGMNEIRERAGIALLDEGDITLDRVRDERQVELAFENHRYWDIRRWRIAGSIMDDTQFAALYPYYVVEEDAWIFETTGVGNTKNYEPRFNYEPISQAEINRNPRLVQNPGY